MKLLVLGGGPAGVTAAMHALDQRRLDDVMRSNAIDLIEDVGPMAPGWGDFHSVTSTISTTEFESDSVP